VWCFPDAVELMVKFNAVNQLLTEWNTKMTTGRRATWSDKIHESILRGITHAACVSRILGGFLFLSLMLLRAFVARVCFEYASFILYVRSLPFPLCFPDRFKSTRGPPRTI
jgi:hypothetical protein